MNKMLSTTLYFVAGLGVGYGVGYFITKKRLNDQYNQDVRDVKEYYSSRVVNDDNVSGLAEAFRNKYGDALDRLGYSGDPEKLVTMLSNHVDPEEMLNQTDEKSEEESEHIDNPTVETDDVDSFDLFQSMVDARDNRSQKPYIISAAEWHMDYPTADSINLTWYEGDGVLSTENDKPVEDVAKYVGDAIEHFGVASEDPDIVYVYYPAEDAKYEIIRNRKSFNSVVYGVPEEEIENRRILKMREDVE